MPAFSRCSSSCACPSGQRASPYWHSPCIAGGRSRHPAARPARRSAHSRRKAMADVQVNQSPGGGSAGSSGWIWAIVVLVVVALIAWFVFAGGPGGGGNETRIEVETPAGGGNPPPATNPPPQ